MAEGGGQAMKIYLINLDRSPERLARMTEIFSDLGLEFTRLPAVDGACLTQVELDAIAPTRTSGPVKLTVGDVGCFLSHIECWRLIAEGENECAAIFEDDLHFSNSFADFMSDTSWLPGKFDVIKIETSFETVGVLRRVELSALGHSLFSLETKHNGTGGYIFSKDFARRMIERCKVVETTVDYAIFDPASGIRGEGKIYQLSPSICIQGIVLDPKGSPENLLSTIRAGENFQKKQRPTGYSLVYREFSRPFKRAFDVASREIKYRSRGWASMVVPFDDKTKSVR